MMKYKQNQVGFTLLEMMMVVAILGILASIAYPNYTRYIERGHLTNAQAELVKLNLLLKQEHVKNPQADLEEHFNKLKQDNVVEKEVRERYDISYFSEAGSRYRLVVVPALEGYTLAAWMDSLGNRYRCDNAAAAKSYATDGDCEEIK